MLMFKFIREKSIRLCKLVISFVFAVNSQDPQLLLEGWLLGLDLDHPSGYLKSPSEVRIAERDLL
jgi:hypothetical protein